MASSDKFKEKIDELNLSEDELKRLSDAFKKEEFRKLFAEYAEEISNPENRKKYEDEIAQMERDRGMDVQFIHPEPKYVLKTTIDGKSKAFINICTNDLVEKPRFEKKMGNNGRMGQQWHLPHSLAPPRDDIDKEQRTCKVFDFVVHNDTMRLAESNARFKEMLQTTALESIEKNFNVTLDHKNLKFPKIKFKGTPQATVIRNKSDDAKPQATDPNDSLQFPYPYGSKTTEQLAKENQAAVEKREKEKKKQEAKELKKSEIKVIDEATTPQYSILHRSNFDMQNYRQAPEEAKSTRPTELVVSVDLPLLKSAKTVDLDIFERKLLLKSESPAKYFLDLKLPYPVDDNLGSARFDKPKRQLIVTLVVKQVEEKVNLSSVDLPTSESHNDNPLIEELSDSTPSEVIANGIVPNGHITTNGHVQNGHHEEEDIIQPNVLYNCPEYRLQQTDDVISVVLDVANIDSTKLMTSSTTSAITFSTMGEGGFPRHYRLVMKPAAEKKFSEGRNQVKVTDDNIVWLVYKSEAEEWDQVYCGVDESQLKERIFVSDNRLKSQLQTLGEDMPTLSVGDEASTIIKVKNRRPSKDDPDDVIIDGDEAKPVETHIEVVQTESAYKTRGILKQRSRTLSDSSDSDIFSSSLSSGGMGPTRRENSVQFNVPEKGASRKSSMQSVIESGSISESEQDEDSVTSTSRKKTVSFSEYVEKTSFKSSMSVSSMKQTIKNKRKSKRKKDMRAQVKQEKQERRRRRSSGSTSELSSDELSLGSRDGSHKDDTEEDDDHQNELDEDDDDAQSPPADDVTLAEPEVNGTAHSDDVKVADQGDAPETMLSWNDAKIEPNPLDSLKPVCQVKLSNSLMYDLDDD